jgi:hypothetical protein
LTSASPGSPPPGDGTAACLTGMLREASGASSGVTTGDRAARKAGEDAGEA